jgi:hypothetical protein
MKKYVWDQLGLWNEETRMGLMGLWNEEIRMGSVEVME